MLAKLYLLIQKGTCISAVFALLLSSILLTSTKNVLAFAGGDGSSGDPYLIASCSDFSDINDDTNAYYELASDLNCTSTGNNIMIEQFSGSLNGNDHTIQIALNTSSNETGLFRSVLTGEISDLNISGTINTTGQYTGLLAGAFVASSAQNIAASGAIISSSHLAGGLLGASGCGSSLTSSHSSVDVTGSYAVGGVVGSDACGSNGSNYSLISSTGDVIGGNHVGGFIGDANSTIIDKSYSTGSVNAEENAGGFIGDADGCTVTKSFATGSVALTNYATNAGGFVGATTGSDNQFTDVYSRGSVTAAEAAGGFLGYSAAGTQITNGYATGLVTADVGFGGFLGPAEGGTNVQSSFWDKQTTGTENGGDGIGKTTLEMKDIETYTDETTVGLAQAWDFVGFPIDDSSDNDIWDISRNKNDGYPCFTWSEISCSPNPGDYNDDGTLDSLQNNISSYISPITGKRVLIDVGESCEIISDDIGSETSNEVQDPAYDFGNGMFDIAGDCGTSGFTTTVKLYFYEVPKENLVLRKYNSNNNSYFNLSNSHSAIVEETTINGQLVLVASFNITDGGELDMDNLSDGQFEDPVGLATAVLRAPNTGLKKNL